MRKLSNTETELKKRVAYKNLHGQQDLCFLSSKLGNYSVMEDTK